MRSTIDTRCSTRSSSLNDHSLRLLPNSSSNVCRRLKPAGTGHTVSAECGPSLKYSTVLYSHRTCGGPKARAFALPLRVDGLLSVTRCCFQSHHVLCCKTNLKVFYQIRSFNHHSALEVSLQWIVRDASRSSRYSKRLKAPLQCVRDAVCVAVARDNLTLLALNTVDAVEALRAETACRTLQYILPQSIFPGKQMTQGILHPKFRKIQ